jgi:nicotinate-nucleotide pyrophosphorylase (carboxylating)
MLSRQVIEDAVRTNVAAALGEDLGAGDLTAALLPEHSAARARVITREPCVLAGGPWFERCFASLDPGVRVTWSRAEGERLSVGEVVCVLHGATRALLSAERCALNFLQTLSAVATETRRYVDAVAGTGVHILDTRKTLPGLRVAEKYAVGIGGGMNQRIGLFDAVLIKENHIAAAGGIATALERARAASPAGTPIQIEVESLDELGQALDAGAGSILLDNFDVARLREAVRLNAHRAVLEASGGITLENVRVIAETGVDRISIGSLTKNVRAVDLSMRLSADP